jgi:hypothetical protein
MRTLDSAPEAGVGSDVNTEVAGSNEFGREPCSSRSTKEVGLDAERFSNIDPEAVPVQLSDAEAAASEDACVSQGNRAEL